MAAPSGARPLETGWLPDTPVDDTLLRRFLYNQADLNAATARALGGRADRTDAVFLADGGSRFAHLNQALPTRPLDGPGDPLLEDVDRFFAPGRPASLLSLWPTPDLSARGWTLVGHPMLVVRSPGPVRQAPRPGVTVRTALTATDLASAEQVGVEGFPLGDGQPVPAGLLFPPPLVEAGLVVRLGLFDDEPVGVGNAFTAHGVVNLCLAATLPAARRRGVWEALVWARVDDAPDLPAVAYTSDDSRPGFVRLGFLPIMRLTLWERPEAEDPCFSS